MCEDGLPGTKTNTVPQKMIFGYGFSIKNSDIQYHALMAMKYLPYFKNDI
ncbi:MAG: hypothetical protein ACFFAN_07530 [Promethearchaeota archaeon]